MLTCLALIIGGYLLGKLTSTIVFYFLDKKKQKLLAERDALIAKNKKLDEVLAECKRLDAKHRAERGEPPPIPPKPEAPGPVYRKDQWM